MFLDRYDAAQQLAIRLDQYTDNKEVIILAIPRGALEIGSVLAKELHAPLDVIFSKKIGAPGDPEYAIGTVSMDDVTLAPHAQGDPTLQSHIQEQIKEIRAKLEERSKQYRGNKPPLDLKDKIVILTDDGIATGNTLMLAVQLIKTQNPKKIIVAIPVGPQGAIEKIQKKVDEVICLLIPDSFMGISQFYRSFPQVEDEKAIELLKEANT